MVNEAPEDDSELARSELPVGDDQVIVVYEPPDLGVELDAAMLMTAVAADATRRARDGWRIVSLDTLNVRHSGIYLGQQGSGFETKVAIVVVFGRAGGAT